MGRAADPMLASDGASPCHTLFPSLTLVLSRQPFSESPRSQGRHLHVAALVAFGSVHSEVSEVRLACPGGYDTTFPLQAVAGTPLWSR